MSPMSSHTAARSHHHPRRLSGTATGILCAALAGVLLQADSRAHDAGASAAMEKFLAEAASASQYRGWRRLDATGSGHRAWLEVTTEFSRDTGLRYEVTAEGGSGYIRSRVLRSLIDEEQELIACGCTAQADISTDNYVFEPAVETADGLVTVRAAPRRKQRSLIAGQLFLTPADGHLVRFEGRLAKNPSFWVTRTHVIRSYRQINGVRMPVALESSAQLRFLGASSLHMTYHYDEIDGRPVVEEPSEPEPER